MEFKADTNPVMSSLSYNVGDELARGFDSQKFRVKVVEIFDGKVITEILEIVKDPIDPEKDKLFTLEIPE